MNPAKKKRVFNGVENQVFNNLAINIAKFLVINNYELGFCRISTLKKFIINNYKFLLIFYKNDRWRIINHDQNCNNIKIVKCVDFPNNIQKYKTIKIIQFKNLIYKFERLMIAQSIEKNDNDFQIFMNYGNNKLQFINLSIYKNLYNIFPTRLINISEFQNFSNPANRSNQNVLGIYQNNVFNKFSYKSTIIIQLYNYDKKLELNKTINFIRNYISENITYDKERGIIILKGYNQYGFNQLRITNGYGIYVKKNNCLTNNIENIYKQLTPFITNYNLTYCAYILTDEICKPFIPYFYIRKNINDITIDFEYYCKDSIFSNSIINIQNNYVKDFYNNNCVISRMFISILFKLVKNDFTLLTMFKYINIQQFYNMFIYIFKWKSKNIEKFNYHILFKNYTKLAEIYNNSIPDWISNIYKKIYNKFIYNYILFVNKYIMDFKKNSIKTLIDISNYKCNEILFKLNTDEEFNENIKSILTNISNEYYQKINTYITSKTNNENKKQQDNLKKYIKLICTV